MRKEWKTPELVILVRMKPEESILVTCKNIPMVAGPMYGVNGCTPTTCQLEAPT